MRAFVPLLLSLCTASCVVGCTVNGEPADLRRTSDASADVTVDNEVGDGSVDDAGDAALDGAVDGAPDADATIDTGSDAQSEAQPESGPTGSCATATELELPPVGETATLVVDLVGADADLTGTCGGSNVERVVWLEPTEDAAVLITAGAGSLSPVLYLLADQCISGVSAQEMACQSGVSSPQIMTQLEAGRTFFIVIDSNGASSSMSTVLTILRLS
jgi:hypothetical protein